MTPFAPNSISLGLYAHRGVQAPERVETMLRQAKLAGQAGFDGVTVSEHHGRFPGYLPHPLLLTSWMLSDLERAWAAPMPLLPPLQSPGLLLEEIALVAARFPGRLGIGTASGYAPSDFEVADAAYGGRFSRHWQFVERLCRARHPDGPHDPCSDDVVDALALLPLPIVAAVSGPVGLAKAGRLGVGVLPTGGDAPAVAEKVSAYRQAGGRGPVVGFRWVWLGDGAVELPSWQLEHVGSAAWVPRATLRRLVREDPAELAAAIHAEFSAASATSINVRLHTPDTSAGDVERQITALGERVLPVLRDLLDAEPLLGNDEQRRNAADMAASTTRATGLER